MSQSFTDDCFAAGNAGLTDLQNMENNFLALKSMFSGSSAPGNTTAGMPWADTGNKILKIRNSANDAWLSVINFSTVSTLAGAAYKLDRNITAGTGLSGGGQLTTDITINVSASGIDETQLKSSAVTLDKIALGARPNLGSAAGVVSLTSDINVYRMPFEHQNSGSSIGAYCNLQNSTGVITGTVRILSTADTVVDETTGVSLGQSTNYRMRSIGTVGTSNCSTGTWYSVCVHFNSGFVPTAAVDGVRYFYK